MPEPKFVVFVSSRALLCLSVLKCLSLLLFDFGVVLVCCCVVPVAVFECVAVSEFGAVMCLLPCLSVLKCLSLLLFDFRAVLSLLLFECVAVSEFGAV